MTLVEQINADLKQALLSGDKELVFVLRGLRSVILNEEVAQGKRDTGIDESVIISLFQKEVKKRQEAIVMYESAGSADRAKQEKYEVEQISKYLPEMMSEEEVKALVDAAVVELGASDMSKMGQVIGAVKAKSEGRADGALIAKIVKDALQ